MIQSVYSLFYYGVRGALLLAIPAYVVLVYLGRRRSNDPMAYTLVIGATFVAIGVAAGKAAAEAREWEFVSDFVLTLPAWVVFCSVSLGLAMTAKGARRIALVAPAIALTLGWVLGQRLPLTGTTPEGHLYQPARDILWF